MKGLRLSGYYFFWHYGRALTDMRGIFGNILWFLLNFFSIITLLKTFFAPFQRLHESYGRGFDPEYIIGSFLVNTLMRAVGMVLRSCVIVCGVVTLVATVILEFAFFVFWFFVPLLVLTLFFGGVALLFSLV